MKSISFESILSVSLILLSVFFIAEVIHYFNVGEWVIHSGQFGFEQWPQPLRQNMPVLIHGLGMFLWVSILVYQLKSKGKQFHVVAGYIGFAILVVALAISISPIESASVPTLHGLFYMTSMDVILICTLTIVIVESICGILKIKERRFLEHKQHLIAVVMFTLAPGVYRFMYFVIAHGIEWANNAALTSYQSIWVHEMAACLALLLGLMVLSSKRFGGQVTVLLDKKSHATRPRWHKAVALFMVSLFAFYFVVASLWVLDLLIMGLHQSIEPFSREHAQWFNLYM